MTSSRVSRPLAFLLLLSLSSASPNSSELNPRNARLFSYFNSITFRNEECTGNSEDQDIKGICMTEEECTDINGGVKMGNCAQGFGTCCHVRVDSCGSTINKNNTYIQNPEFPGFSTAAQTCTFNFERNPDDEQEICFFRLDFIHLRVAGHNTNPSPTAGIPPGPNLGDCATDAVRFQEGVTNYRVQDVCGNLDGQHMYLDAGAEVGHLPSSMSIVTMGTANMRRWNIKTAQIPCGQSYTPWQGCRQYFTKNGGQFMSYNFNGGYHLNKQEYTICIRRNVGMCRVSYRAADIPHSFRLNHKLMNNPNPPSALNGRTTCMADYSVALFTDSAFGGGCNVDENNDHLNQPGDHDPSSFGNRYCGSAFACIQTFSGQRGEIIQNMSPFEFTLHTNVKDTQSEDTNTGFAIDFLQLPC